ncbi:hypothetical protein P3X46_001622 [Hevea brasiliensis]|uniref:Endonuclease/exonuclease/phosphatase domain-containing protein n=1 Tax=Hevea brasiliensis TaxID=3981 RepID=A0ABQ9NG09_HEVBR|nr:hypothetical protein P3X46_001622 [Hevea brasiliensis]
MSIMCWNCQGATGRDFRQVLKMVVNINKPNMIVLLEPQISRIKADRVIAGFGYSYSHRVKAQGFASGIWVIWNDVWQIEVVLNCRQFIHLQLYEFNRVIIEFIAVYGHPMASQRAVLWEELKWLVLDEGVPWLLEGDFIVLLNPSEKKRGSLNRSGVCNLFSNWFNEKEMHDLGFKGPSFTWSRGGLLERLDGVICNTHGVLNFPEASVFHLVNMCLDHKPILVCLYGSPPPAKRDRSLRFLIA